MVVYQFRNDWLRIHNPTIAEYIDKMHVNDVIVHKSGDVDKYYGMMEIAVGDEFMWVHDPDYDPDFVYKGGEGSGNYDHAGRPGKVGGSQAASNIVIFTRMLKGILHDRAIMTLPDDATMNSDIAPGVKREPKAFKAQFGTCYANAYLAYKNKGERVFIGVQLDKEAIEHIITTDMGKYWSPAPGIIGHAWNVNDKGQVVDHALGTANARGALYIGKEITKDVLDSFEGESDLHKADNLYRMNGDYVMTMMFPKDIDDTQLTKLYDEWSEQRKNT